MYELLSDAVELAARYLSVTNEPRMRGMAKQLQTALVAILDEGRKQQEAAAESAVIGTAAEAQLESLKLMGPALVRVLLDEERLAWTIDCMFSCVASAQDRI